MNKNKVILVTGASSGIGRASATYLASKGHTVYGTSRKDIEVDQVNMIVMDVDNDDSVKSGVEHVIRQEGRIDVIVNNAGYAMMGSIEDSSIVEAKQVFETNVFGIIRVCQAALPHMRKHKKGLIINVSSIGGLMGLPFRGIYCASKFALEGLSETLRFELEQFGIDVTLIEPGDMKTEINQNRSTATAALNGSVYSSLFGISKKQINEDVENGSDPEMIGKAIESIIQTSKPKVRYHVGYLVQKLSVPAKRILPSGAFEWILKKYYKLS